MFPPVVFLSFLKENSTFAKSKARIGCGVSMGNGNHLKGELELALKK